MDVAAIADGLCPLCLQSRLASLNAEVTVQKDELILLREQCIYSPAFSTLLNRALLAKVTALREALEKYGLCKCPIFDMREKHLDGCGLAAALAAVKLQ